MINFKKLGFSIKTALKGLRSAVREEQTFKIQLGIGILVLFLMFCFPLTRIERTILVLTVSLVLSLELINSQIERILDFLQPNHDPKVKLIKDLSAGAVLLSVLGSIIIGLLIFLPYVL
ncbi:MAG: diacylglycerol kinase [Candidatus Nealsonbacteria bacterium]|nr:MAG: diacylglycerol kinase [Candidatus Nealsonbacteria bacterium]